MAESLYFARRSMTYGNPGNEKQLDRNQIFDLQGCRNDDKLLRLNYIAIAPKGTTVVQCGQCGAEFITDEALNAHGRERHSRRLAPDEIVLDRNGKPIGFRGDIEADQKLAHENEVAPLDLTKTAASRGYVHSPGGK